MWLLKDDHYTINWATFNIALYLKYNSTPVYIVGRDVILLMMSISRRLDGGDVNISLYLVLIERIEHIGLIKKFEISLATPKKRN